MYATTLLCTGVSRPPLAFSPPIPIDIESDMGIQVGATPYAAGSLYGLPTSSLTHVVRRNYEPHRDGWRITGTLGGVFSASGYAESPGEIDEDNPIIFPPDPLITPFTINIDSGAPTGHPVERPEFAITPRIVASVSHQQSFISSGFFPAGRSPSTGEVRACYLITTFSITAQLNPYSWEYRDQYYLEHDIRVTSTSALYNGIGGEEFLFEEGVSAGPSGNVYTQLAGSILPSGAIAVRDPLITPGVLWGIQTFYGSSAGLGDVGLLQPSLIMTCSVHYLPSPDL